MPDVDGEPYPSSLLATPIGWGLRDAGRWAWRRLTSMTTALILLFLLALAAIPGSLVPQRPVDPVAVVTFRSNHRSLARWYDRFGLFDVFASPWFSAIYLLLMISLVGCVIPRVRVYLRAVRSTPPPAPARLERLQASDSRVMAGTPEDVVASAAAALRARRYRVSIAEDGTSVAGQRGYLREAGNLVFHLSLIVVLVGIALGHLYGLRGSALVVEGEGFADTQTQFDNLRAGPMVDLNNLPPFSVQLDDFTARYQETGNQQGAARDFEARVTYRPSPSAPPQQRVIRVNQPLQASGARLFLGPHGYAPVITVRDGSGSIAYQGPVPFLPMDPVGLGSRGVIKVPDARPQQLGFQGFFLPTAALDLRRGPFSMFPAARNPRLILNAWAGDLGLDQGIPQSVYRLDTRAMRQIMTGKTGSTPASAALAVGDTWTLPGGRGSLTFDGYREWVVLQINNDPGKLIALAGAAVALASLVITLTVRPRRIWVRAHPDGEHTRVVVGALARTDGVDLTADIAEVLSAMSRERADPADEPLGAMRR